MRRVILHLCADIGSDSRPYALDDAYEVVLIGKEIGVENYYPDRPIHGIIANPVCTEFSQVRRGKRGVYYPYRSDPEAGMFLVKHCLRIIEATRPRWWVLENPATGSLQKFIGKPRMTYQPWEYGSPWTKKTALWGKFNEPQPLYSRWEDVPNKLPLWARSGRKPSIVYLHKSSVTAIPEFSWASDLIKTDSDLRSMCSQGFAKAFKEVNP